MTSSTSLSFLSLISFAANLPTISATPKALPVANPNAWAWPEPEPQQVVTNAPFSGAIYLVDPNGNTVTSTSQNYCPASAPLSCSTNGAPSWCCPQSYTCAPALPTSQYTSGLIGCCPSGSTCSGSLLGSSISTVTVAVGAIAPAPTVFQQADDDDDDDDDDEEYVVGSGVNVCSTLTAVGAGLPTLRAGRCGTILVVEPSEASRDLEVIGIWWGGLLLTVMSVVGTRLLWW